MLCGNEKLMWPEYGRRQRGVVRVGDDLYQRAAVPRGWLVRCDARGGVEEVPPGSTTIPARARRALLS